MDSISVPSTVSKITILKQGEDGETQAVLVYDRSKTRKKRKKQSFAFRRIGKAMKMILEGERTHADEYLQKHKESNRKKRDGWLMDLVPNMIRARWKGLKKLRVRRLLLG